MAQNYFNNKDPIEILNAEFRLHFNNSKSTFTTFFVLSNNQNVFLNYSQMDQIIKQNFKDQDCIFQWYDKEDNLQEYHINSTEVTSINIELWQQDINLNICELNEFQIALGFLDD
ncbi:hypothetical protein PPERSA_11253 [Pseudocohnilembus persalinus]|uniref:Uncharacterized protein n=1 Tax=Pseudocohnilembus persalinus TaxID=266149 RepID=A0A0V0R0M1_PSEPJ|nr:hypothetical protein PPERSA_11253 [Pseudocohnilembus persalinus]|eukprot:KRX07704.1 hypothetical protein PPERSA_11253 [Pseudocohnilembus persalinus]